MAIAKHPFTKTLMKPVWIAAFLFVLFSVIVVGITAFRFYHYGPVEHFWDRLLMESYGMLLDVLVIGIFLLWLNQKGRSYFEIQRYHDEIEDFRGWRFQEAAFRISGNIKRLNRNGVTGIDLSRCTLRNMDLRAVNLEGAGLVQADLRDAYLARAVLRSADLNGAGLRRAFLWQADLKEAILVGADLRDANLESADLSGAYIQGCDLGGADLTAAILTGTKGLTPEQLSGTKTLFNAVIDSKIEAQIQKVSPRLLKDPGSSREH